MTTSQADLRYIRALVERESAILIEERQTYLLEARLRPVAREVGCVDLAELVHKLRSPAGHALRARVVDAMTTNETSFYRNGHPFEALREHVLPTLMRARADRRLLRVWCGAASSGQEPYTVAMVCQRVVPRSWRVDQVATDLSAEMIQRCKAGSYTQFEVNRGLSAADLARWFERDGARWTVKDELKLAVRFGTMNLVRPWPATMGKFDIIFMRNVLIYFEDSVKAKVLERARQHLAPDGYLFLGTAESPSRYGVDLRRERVGASICFRP